MTRNMIMFITVCVAAIWLCAVYNKNCKHDYPAVVPYEPGMTLQPGQSTVITIGGLVNEQDQ